MSLRESESVIQWYRAALYLALDLGKSYLILQLNLGSVNGTNLILEDIPLNLYLMLELDYCFLQNVILEYHTADCCFMTQC